MPPSDPELLDWLAAELMENDWSLKHLHRVILSSEAYRRSSRDSEVNANTDPGNRLFWRQNLRRLDAESAREESRFIAAELGRDATSMDSNLADVSAFTALLMLTQGKKAEAVELFLAAGRLYGLTTPKGQQMIDRADQLLRSQD